MRAESYRAWRCAAQRAQRGVSGALARLGGCATVAAVDRTLGRRLIAALVVLTLLGTPAAAQEAPAETNEPSETAPAHVLPGPTPPAEPVRDYWPLLAAGIGVVAGGLAGARLANLEAERWQAMPDGTANRQQQIDAWNTWTVAGSVAATVGVGLVVLWGTIRLSQASAAPARP